MSSKKIEWIILSFFRCLYLTYIIQLAFARVSVDETFVLWCEEVLFVTLQSIFVDTVRRSWYLHNLNLLPVTILPPVLFTLHIRILWSQTSQSLTVFIWKNINICHAKVIQYENLSHDASNDNDFTSWMFVFFSIKLVKLYEVWLQSNLICELKRTGGSILY